MHNGINSDKLREECGVLGIFQSNTKKVSRQLYYGLYSLQHRGQQSAGISTSDGSKNFYHKGMGLVPEVFNDDNIEKLDGNIGIGHVRYGSSEENYIENAQPLVVRYRGGSISLAHNGSLVNAPGLKERLVDDGVVFQTSNDIEVVANLVARYSTDGIDEAIVRTLDMVKGAYAMVMMTEKCLYGIRDPYGVRPLCLGKLDDGYVLASESCALEIIGATLVRDIEPGEIIKIDKDGVQSSFFSKNKQKSVCIFEYIYFARPDSIMENMSIYNARKNAGKVLAGEHPTEADMVIAAPDSSIPAAIGYAEASGIPFGEGLIKNRYIGRTFIQPTQELRELAVRLKLSPLKENIQGKRLILIDDSIVRGTTSKRTVKSLKEAGAKEVHVRISSPPVAYSCHFGIDTPDRKQLLGATKTVEQIRRFIDADSLAYISTKGLVESTGLPNDAFCLGCFDGNYPMEVPGKDSK
ncbi:amidophosphoribosyltransferase [Serpentinicella sp. ANB-PHB4]|uniref:amidophosphoribosyltransferase n=1 Tax=Serpentinicella sp. ANB-PHB4 TaxID=3074076 RepID=UPI00285F3ACC|nr:amidophosphoribosyltransferase [Serpentinicella sp. ANB-PHB4]MDR5658593.1 amidophosphoribosyltransferase [Serpentinicella sp. ANB-PHB4]